jgi:hypothetical protein
MSYPSNRTDRYLKVAAEFSDLANSASSDFSRTYYRRTAERYQALAAGQISLPEDNAIPTQPACSPPAETTQQPSARNGRGAAHMMRELARRVGRLASRPAR